MHFQMLGMENKTGSEDLVRRGLFRFESHKHDNFRYKQYI